jgi:hypothetical protein
MKIIRILLFLTFLVPVYSQINNKKQLDSLYNAFVERYNYKEDNISTESPEHIKCAFGIASEVVKNLDRYTVEQRQLLKTLLDRPTKQKSLVSPSGFFRIHYDTTGSDIPNYNTSLSADENAMQVGIAADSAYNFEVNYLGYPPPPGDGSDGGDNKLDIYITSLSAYGGTTPERSLGNQKYTSYIEIHYDFQGSGFATHGLDAMHVTVAHEFHHTIQVGNYTGDKYDVDGFFYEMTSTSMEEFVYNSVNDYYAYMKSYFNNPNRIFNSFRAGTNDGYDLAVWNIFLKNKFGYDIIKKQWELFPNLRALTAIQSSLLNQSSSLSESLNEFGIWTFFTNYRTIPGKYFDEAANYPLMKLTATSYIPSSPVSINNIKASSNNFLAIINSSVSPNDSLVAIITNSDYTSANDSSNKNFNFDYTLAPDSIDGSVMLTDNYYAKFNVDQPNLWSVSEILNNQVVRQGGIIYTPVKAGEEIFAYPNPFHYGINKSIIIVADHNGETKADLNVYTPAMELVFSKTLTFVGNTLTWEIGNKKLASGVYIFAAKIGNKTSVGKLVIFDE